MDARIIPIKCALRYTPPLLVLVYKDENSGKVRRRSMPLRGFTTNTEISLYILELKTSRNKLYINSIPETQLSSLLTRIKCAQLDKKTSDNFELKDRMVHSSLQGLPSLSVPSGITHHTNYSPSMKLDSGDAGFDTKFRTLDEKFSHALNVLLSDEDSDNNPDHKDSSTDLPASAPAIQKPMDGAEKSNGDNVSAEIPDYSADFNSESEKIGNMLQEGKLRDSNDDSCSLIEELEDEEGNVEVDSGGEKFEASHLQGNLLQEEDLNKISEEQLLERKAEMDILFEANRLRPEDERYEYDREVEFGGSKVESGWDSDGSSLEF